VPASAPREVIAREVADGIYEVPVEMAESGAYYVFVSVPSLKLGYNDSGFLSLIARPQEAAAAASAKAQ